MAAETGSFSAPNRVLFGSRLVPKRLPNGAFAEPDRILWCRGGSGYLVVKERSAEPTYKRGWCCAPVLRRRATRGRKSRFCWGFRAKNFLFLVWTPLRARARGWGLNIGGVCGFCGGGGWPWWFGSCGRAFVCGSRLGRVGGRGLGVGPRGCRVLCRVPCWCRWRGVVYGRVCRGGFGVRPCRRAAWA